MNHTSSTDISFSSSQRPGSDTISRRAYELWEQEGRPEGSDLRHWLQAEQELSGRGNSSASNGTYGGTDNGRQQASDARPLQGTRAGAAANREGKRASRSPFATEKSSTAASGATGAKSDLTSAGRRRN